jgi:exodeoxyribonuclease V gamma subunit
MGEEEVLQSALFLELRRHIAVATPVERWKEAWGNVGGYSHSLPAADRLTIIGPYSLPGADRYVEAIQSLSAHMDVAMYAPTSGPIELLETSDESKTEAHRLWGGAQRSIAPLVRRLHAMSETDVALAQQPLPTTVLGALQRAIITDEFFSIGSPDNSLVVHGCYGEARQAEVLRDAILHDLAESDNEKFGESNILVVCPDLATFAPLIRSAFGEPRREELTASKGTEPQLAFTIIDPQGSSEGLYLRGLRHFIELINGRCQRTEVLSFFEEPTVARALRFTQDSTALHDTWTRAAGIRWGLSGSHREHLGLGSLGDANTWAAGLRRMSLGVLVDNPSLRTSGGILPVEIAPGHLDEYAAFALGVRHLATAHDGRIAPLSLAKWLDWFDRSRHALLLAEGDEAKEEERVLQALQPLREASTRQSAALTFHEFVRILSDCLDTVGSIGALLTGGITVTAPNALVGVPFESVYILGLDDNAFLANELERADLRRDEMKAGDVAPSDQARSQFAAAVISARRRLTILTNAANVLTGKKTDPSIVMSEIRDALEDCTASEIWPDRNDPKSHILQPFVVKHPRNPFSGRNFATESKSLQPARDRGVFKGPWSYSTIDFALANIDESRMLRDNATWTPRLAALPASISVDELISFVRNPPRTYVQRTLGISLGRDDEDDSNELDAQGGGLVHYKALERLWEQERAHIDHREAADMAAGMTALQSSGDAPPDPLLGSESIQKQVRAFANLYQSAIDGGQSSQEFIRVEASPVEITGHVDVFRVNGRMRLVEVVLSKCRLEKMIGPWLRACLVAQSTNEDVELHLIFRKGEDEEESDAAPVEVRIFTIPGGNEDSRTVLDELINLYVSNLSTPLPYWPGEKLSMYTKQKLEEEWWRNEEYEPKSSHHLGDKYWRLCFGHLTAKEVMSNHGPHCFQQLLIKFRRLLSEPLPLFDFATEIGSSK